MNKEKISRLAKEFGAPAEMIARLFSIGVSEELMRKSFSQSCSEKEMEEKEEEDREKRDAYWINRWHKHAKKILGTTNGK